MSIKSALATYLHSLVSGRVYPDVLPLHATPVYPAITYIRSGTQRSKTFCGTDGMIRSTFQIDVWAVTYAEADSTAIQVKIALIDFVGMMGGSPGTDVRDLALDSESDFFDPEPGLYRVSMTYGIWHQE